MVRLWLEQIALNEECSKKFIFYVQYVFFSFSLLFPFFMPKSESLPSLFAQLLFFKEQWEQLALVTLDKRATMSYLLSLLMTKKSDGSDLLIFTNESLFCSQKMSDLLEKPMSKSPTLTEWKAGSICIKNLKLKIYSLW